MSRDCIHISDDILRYSGHFGVVCDFVGVNQRVKVNPDAVSCLEKIQVTTAITIWKRF